MKILGIDTGTNSLGWAIVEKTNNEYKLLDHGSHIFQEGVTVKGMQVSSKAAERTAHRALRKRYYRIKLRKIALLRLLIQYHLCPPLSKDELANWHLKGIYPTNEDFLHWQATDDNQGINPYACRHTALHTRLNWETDPTQAYVLGRALYHINQRRGFLSNRKDANKSTDDSGTVKQGIDELTKAMSNANCTYLGDYFYLLYEQGNKIRQRYTHRTEHYLKEFNAICQCQQLPEDLIDRLKKVIFSQRPLKSQKHTIGKCVFEPAYAKCPTSHPLFEEYRMLCFVNNIRIQTVADLRERPLTPMEKEKILPVFYLKHNGRTNFDFSELADKLAGKNQWCHKSKLNSWQGGTPTLFNYYPDTSVACCPVTRALMDIFGDQWEQTLYERYKPTKTNSTTRLQVVDEVWNVLQSFDNDDKLAEWGKKHLGLDEKQVKQFVAIHMPSAYASLSLCALRKIVPYLRSGYTYSTAVFLANLGAVIAAIKQDKVQPAEVERFVVAIIQDTRKKQHEWDDNHPNREMLSREELAKNPRPDIRTAIQNGLRSQYKVDEKHLRKLYHPSQIQVYPQRQPNENGICFLGSPRTDTLRNPTAMRSLFRIREVLNMLLKEGKIDADTEIHIEFARELNDANRRQAILKWQKKEEADRQKARTFLQQERHIANPTDTDILKYQLWEEQKHKCPYTGHQIEVQDIWGPQSTVDIEHTIPRSRKGESTKSNNTLCDSDFNRNIKKTHLPSEIPSEELSPCFEQFKAYCKKKYEDLDKQIRNKRTNASMDKETKDRTIQERHKLVHERNYWFEKYTTFVIKDEGNNLAGFSRRQGTDISVITRTAFAYLQSVFTTVQARKGLTTSVFRKLWGIQDYYAPKERVNHIHHCIDAIVIACIGEEENRLLATYYQDEDAKQYGIRSVQHPALVKLPWATFVKDIQALEQTLLVAHYTADNACKKARRKVRDSKRHIQTDDQKQPLLQISDSIRGSLHTDSYYGAIKQSESAPVSYVIRKSLVDLPTKNIPDIVDPTVRAIVEKAVQADPDALKYANTPGHEIWMNQEKKIPIHKVRILAHTKDPLHIRQQRDLSSKDYKRQFHVVNEGNYMMAIYKGTNAKGKEQRDFQLVSLLEAATKQRAAYQGDKTLVPLTKTKGDLTLHLAFTLKTGTMVLLYENSPKEISTESPTLSQRLYKIYKMKKDGRIYLRHHQEARPEEVITHDPDSYILSGTYKNNDKRNTKAALRVLSPSSMNMLVQGYDFTLDALGRIHFLH